MFLIISSLKHYVYTLMPIRVAFATFLVSFFTMITIVFFKHNLDPTFFRPFFYLDLMIVMIFGSISVYKSCE